MIQVFGYDFTSAPSKRKSIARACAVLQIEQQNKHVRTQLFVNSVDRLATFEAFEQALAMLGPWVAGFDFPFGLPRELIETLGWPNDWAALVSYVRDMGKPTFKIALDAVRESRLMGARYIARRGDFAAGSSSPMKLVNPPVGLMFFEGAPRLLSAGVSVIPCAHSSDSRIALEAYPGFLARQFTKKSYKKDGREGSTPERVAARRVIVETIIHSAQLANPLLHGLVVQLATSAQTECIEDGSGDTLDAVLCAVQAAISACKFAKGDACYGIPENADPLEGWIATVP
jgi:hypothetical protein